MVKKMVFQHIFRKKYRNGGNHEDLSTEPKCLLYFLYPFRRKTRRAGDTQLSSLIWGESQVQSQHGGGRGDTRMKL